MTVNKVSTVVTLTNENSEFISDDFLVAREQELRKINEDLDCKLNNIKLEDVEEIPEIAFGDWKRKCHVNPSNLKKEAQFSNVGDDDEHNMVTFFEELTVSNDVKSKSSNPRKPRNITNLGINDSDKAFTNATNNHLQNVQIKAMTKQLDQAIKSSSELSKTNNELQTKLSHTQETNRKLQFQVNKLQTSLSKKSNESKVYQNQVDDFSLENNSLKKELSKLRSIVKECETQSQTNEVKLKRAIESVEKYKTMILNFKSSNKENEVVFGQEKKIYETKINELTKQRDELIIGFKKQMQLIHILKRQKVHLEASRLLDFTEEEFLKVVDWGSVSTTKQLNNDEGNTRNTATGRRLK